MISYQPTINPDSSTVLKIEKFLTCTNTFEAEIFLDAGQLFQRTEVIVYEDIIDGIPAEQQKNWGVVSKVFQMNKAGTSFDLTTTFVQPLDTFTKGRNSAPLFEKRFISPLPARFTISLSKLDPQNTPEKTTPEELATTFGKFAPITIKASVW